jgi:hypothetical protein
MGSYTYIVESDAVLLLRIYDFLIKPMRDQDAAEGQDFLWRYLLGPQSLWETIQGKIEAIKDLWSITDCPDDYLQYLKRIVGWTPDLDGITEDLSATDLRRLIASSIPLWKTRSTETAIIGILNVLVPARARIWNWFDLRWILDLSIMAEEHQGRDAWLLGDAGVREMNVRVVDNPQGAINKTLVKDVLNLMRPCGENFEIIYLRFLDQFEVDDDLTQWEEWGVPLATPPVVEGGFLKLLDSSQDESLYSAVEDYDQWGSMGGVMISARIRQSTSSGFSSAGFNWYLDPSALNGYYASLSSVGNYLFLGKIVAGVPSTIGDVDLDPFGIIIENDRWYLLRVQCTVEGATNRIKVYIDGVEVADTTDGDYSQGAVSLMHTSGSDLECDEIEVMPLPVESETVEINY